MLSNERIRQIAMEYWSGTCGTRVPDMEKAIRAALAEAAQSPAVPVMREAVAYRVEKLDQDPVYKYCFQEADWFLPDEIGECQEPLYLKPASSITEAELATLREKAAMVDELQKRAERMQKALSDIAEWTDRYTTPGHPISTIARAAIAKERQS